jgi:hypothetical protein
MDFTLRNFHLRSRVLSRTNIVVLLLPEGGSMALYSEKESTVPQGLEPKPVRPVRPVHDVVVMVGLQAKRARVVEVKLRRVAAELEAVTGLRPTPVSVGGGGTAVFGTRSWVSPEILVRLLRARLEQESPNAGMFHFSDAGEAADSIVAVAAARVAGM